MTAEIDYTLRPRRLAWLDIETTGQPEPWEGSLLEVGIFVTEADPLLTPVKDATAAWLVDPEPAHVATMPDIVRKMHTTSGLLDEIDQHRAAYAAGRYPDALVDPPFTVDLNVARFLDDHAHPDDNGKVALAGSGVSHYDARWLRWHLPSTASRLTYWAIDVGVVRRFLRLLGVAPADRSKAKAHRALEDAIDHACEARIYLDLLASLFGAVDAAYSAGRRAQSAYDAIGRATGERPLDDPLAQVEDDLTEIRTAIEEEHPSFAARIAARSLGDVRRARRNR